MSAVFNFTFVPWFRSVAPYIHKFRNQTFVIGLPGEGIAAGKLHNIAQDLALIQAMGVRIVLVHGFRPQVNEQLAAKGHAAKYSHGIRITDSVALDCAQEAAGQLRYEIEAAFSQGLPNTPMAGATVRVISGNFLTARPVGIVDGVDFQHSGLVRKVDVAGIKRTLDMGALVLISPFGFCAAPAAPSVQPAISSTLRASKLAMRGLRFTVMGMLPKSGKDLHCKRIRHGGPALLPAVASRTFHLPETHFPSPCYWAPTLRRCAGRCPCTGEGAGASGVHGGCFALGRPGGET